MTDLTGTAVGNQMVQTLVDTSLVQALVGWPCTLFRVWTNLPYAVLGMQALAVQQTSCLTHELLKQNARLLLGGLNTDQAMVKQGQEVVEEQVDQVAVAALATPLPLVEVVLTPAGDGSSSSQGQAGVRAYPASSDATAQAEVLPPIEVAIRSVGEDKGFYFRGPERRLNLQAENLMEFAQLARQVDDETWGYHLRQGDYTHWFRTVIGDEVLCSASLDLEQATDVTPAESRERILSIIAERYPVLTTA